MKDSEDIEFKPLNSGLGFHARREKKEEKIFSSSTKKKGGDIFPSRAGSTAEARSGKYLPPSQFHVQENISPFLHANARNGNIKRFFINQFFIFSIFLLLCSIPVVQFQLLKQPEHFSSLLKLPILASFGILLAVVEVFYYLFFRQFKLPSFGKWIIERKLKP